MKCELPIVGADGDSGIMGLNGDNLFVRGGDPEAVVAELRRLLPAKKLALSEPLNGWIQVIVAGEQSPPEVAQSLSGALKCQVVCGQLYEVTDDVGWSSFERGLPGERVHSDTEVDPQANIHQALSRFGIPFRMRLFREVVKAPGWRMVRT